MRWIPVCFAMACAAALAPVSPAAPAASAAPVSVTAPTATAPAAAAPLEAPCPECTRRKLERDYTASCSAGGLTTAITFPPECVAMARTRCGYAEDDAETLARAGDHAAASERFEALAFTPAQGCGTSHHLAARAIEEAAAAGDLPRVQALRERRDHELGVIVLPHAPRKGARR